MPASAERIELILEQVDALPTLSAVAVRVIELTSSEDADADELVRVVSSDPALASRLLKLSRCMGRVRTDTITTVERAVLHLGFDTVRSVALSVGVFDQLDRLAISHDEQRTEPAVFDRHAFWRHSLAVASISEQLALTKPLRKSITSGEAFLAGLLHDLGLLALHVLLPRSIDRTCRFAESSGSSIEQACNKVIGITPHTAGRRLAERWKLPRPMIDVIWLHGQRFDLLPEMPHAILVKVVTLADAIARGSYITPAGHTFRGEPIAAMASELRLLDTETDQIVRDLPGTIASRAEALGLDLEPDAALLLESISRANESLGRLNAALRKQADQAEHYGRLLKAIHAFHASDCADDSAADVLARIVASAAPILGVTPIAAIYKAKQDEDWRLVRFTSDGRPKPGGTLTDLDADPCSPGAMVPKRLAIAISNAGASAHETAHEPDVSISDLIATLRFLPVPHRGDVRAALIYEAIGDGFDRDWSQQVETLGAVWSAALEAAASRDQTDRLNEALVNANRLVSETQDEMARQRTMVAIGEIAAGAAHEMNNPLTVISGRAQQLLVRQTDPKLRSMAEEVVKASHRLSDMVTMLRRLTEHATPKKQSANLARIVMMVAQQFSPKPNQEHQINTVIEDSLPEVFLDPEQIGMALAELVKNAVESKGSRHIEIRVQIEPPNDRLRIQVRDDGAGLSLHTLTHAFEPFFSSKGAGRQPGLGLAHARRYVEAHGGRITLENGAGGGALATIWLDDCFVKQAKRRDAA